MPHFPRKRFGQHFLRDISIINKIIASLQLQPQDKVIEIGPGQGALTFPLLQHHSHLTAIEIDRDLIPELQRKAVNYGELSIIQQDVLNTDFSALAASGKKLRLVGNLPYNISTPLLFHLIHYRSVIQDMHFMVQEEVAQRLAAAVNTADYGCLSIMVQKDFAVEYLFMVPPQAFLPPPKVQSAVICLTPYAQSPYETIRNPEIFSDIVHSAFQQRRKMLRNSLAHYFSESELIALNCNPCARPAELSIAEYIRLGNHFKHDVAGECR